MYFYCDEKYSLGHHCKNQGSYVLWVDDFPKDCDSVEVKSFLIEEGKMPEEAVKLSINFLVGLMSLNTIKLKMSITQ